MISLSIVEIDLRSKAPFDDIFEWCDCELGASAWDFDIDWYLRRVTFRFSWPNDALLFKLRWL